MPYHVMKHGSQWCVEKIDGGKKMGCHPTEEKAKAQMAAIYANENKAATTDRIDKRIEVLQQINSLYGDLDALDAQMEAGDEVVVIEGDDGVVEAITIDEPEDDPNDTQPVVVEDEQPQDKSIVTRAFEAFKNFTTKDDVNSAFKAYGDRWLAAWSNNYKDRDGEFFPEKAIDDYIWRVDHGLVPLPELWDSHIPGTRHGQADMVFRVGHFAMATGTFDDTPMGQVAKEYYNRRRNKTEGISHGFLYDTDKFKEQSYWQFNTFELSPLGAFSKAANVYATYEGIKAMTLTEDKKKRLVEKFGQEQADAIISTYEQKSKALDELGIEYKDFAALDGGSETEAVKEAAANADKTFAELVPDMMEGQAEAVKAALESVKLVKALKERIDAHDTEIAALRKELELKPRASQADATVTIDNEVKKALAEKSKDGAGFDPFPAPSTNGNQN